jgi:hypothetical protein
MSAAYSRCTRTACASALVVAFRKYQADVRFSRRRFVSHDAAPRHTRGDAGGPARVGSSTWQQPPPPPPVLTGHISSSPRTKRTRLVLPPVLSGHISTWQQAARKLGRARGRAGLGAAERAWSIARPPSASIVARCRASLSDAPGPSGLSPSPASSSASSAAACAAVRRGGPVGQRGCCGGGRGGLQDLPSHARREVDDGLCVLGNAGVGLRGVRRFEPLFVGGRG